MSAQTFIIQLEQKLVKMGSINKNFDIVDFAQTLDEIFDTFIQQDSWLLNNLIFGTDFTNLWTETLKTYLKNIELITDQIHVQFQAFFKISLFKTNFKLFRKSLLLIFRFFKIQFISKSNQKPNEYVISLLSTVFNGQSYFHSDRYYFLQTKPSEFLEIDVGRFWVNEEFKQFTFMTSFQTNFEALDQEHFLISDVNLSKNVSFKVKLTNQKIYFLIFSEMTLIREFSIFDVISVAKKFSWNFMTLSLKIIGRNCDLLFSFNGNFYHQNIFFDVKDSFNRRLKFVLFENMTFCLNLVYVTSGYFDKKRLEKISASPIANGIGSIDTLKLFFDEINFKNCVLLTGLSKSNLKNNIYNFKDTCIDKNVSYIGLLQTIESNPRVFENEFASFDMFGKLTTLFYFLENKESILNFLINICKNPSIVKMMFADLNRNPFHELKCLLCASHFGEQATLKSIKSIVSILDSNTPQYFSEILNNFVLAFEVLDEILTNNELLNEYFNQILVLLNRNLNLCQTLDLSKIQETILKLYDQKSDHSFAKIHQICRLLFAFLPHFKNVEKMQISPICSVLSFQNLIMSENSISLYLLVLKLIKLNRNTINMKELILFCVSNLLFQTKNIKIIKKSLKTIERLEDKAVFEIVPLWRLKFAPKQVSNIFECYFQYAQTSEKMTDCEKLREYIEGLIFQKDIKDSIHSDVPRIKNNKFFSLVFELAFFLDKESLKTFLLNLNLALNQFSKDFIQNVPIFGFLLWLFTLLTASHSIRKEESIFDLSLKLLTNYISEMITKKSNSKLFYAIFYITGWLQNSKGKLLEVADILTHLFKFLVQKEIKFEKENDFAAFLIFLFIYFRQSFKKTCAKKEFSEQWNCVLMFLNVNLNRRAQSSLFNELLKQISKVFILPAFKILFFRNGFSEKVINYETSVLNMLNLMIFELIKSLSVLGKPAHLTNCVNFLSSIFESLLIFYESKENSNGLENFQEIERFLLKILKFATTFPIVQESLVQINASLTKKGTTKNFQNKFFSKMTHETNAFEFQKLVISLSFEDMEKSQTRIQTDETIEAEIETCYQEAQNSILQCDSLPKLNNELEMHISKWIRDFSAKKLIYFEKKNILFDYLRLDQAINKHFLLNFNKKHIKKQFKHNQFLFPKELNSKVYKTSPISSFDFDSELGSKIIFKHSRFVTKELQKPFLEISTIHPVFVDSVKSTENLFNFESYFSFLRITAYKCTRIHHFSFINGYLFIDDKNKILCFLTDPFGRPKTKHPVELIEFSFKKNDKLRHIWAVSEIAEAHEFKFFQKRRALEIFFLNSQTTIFAFESNLVLQNFTKSLSKLSACKMQKSTDPRTLFRSNEYQKQWENGEISNFKYLMVINFHSSRSFEDFSQYPIFPVVIKSVENEVILRNLSFPIGLVGDEKRKESYVNRYTQFSAFNSGPSYNFGSHYSSPAIVLSYLIRLRPYEKGCLAIQNGCFDLPDRLFFSFKSTLKNIMHDISDVREFIPELFYLPSVYANLNQFDFGINQNGTRVNDVVIPEIFNKNHFKMIYQLRKILESNKISENLGNWIDLVFGQSQLGEKAKKSNNVFYHLTYEGCLDKINIETDQIEATENQIYHFGQTPFQLITQKHPNREFNEIKRNLINSRTSCIFRDLKNVENNLGLEKTYFVKKMRSDEFENLFFIFHVKKTVIVVYRLIDSILFADDTRSFSVRLEEIFPIHKIKEQFEDYLIDYRFYSIIEILPEFKIVYGGFINGKLVICSIKSQKILGENTFHKCTINRIIVVRNERIVTCDDSGIIVCSFLDNVKNSITPYLTLFDFYGFDVCSLNFCQSDFDYFCIDSTKGCFEVRCIRTPEKVLFSLPYDFVFKGRSGMLKRSEFDHCLLSFGYVNCVVFIGYFDGKCDIFTYSFDYCLIGRYLIKDKNCRFVSAFVIKDEYFNDYLITVNEKGDNFLFDLPLLEKGHIISSHDEFDVKNSIVLSENRSIWMINGEGIVRIFSS